MRQPRCGWMVLLPGLRFEFAAKLPAKLVLTGYFSLNPVPDSPMHTFFRFIC
jgi:hypothetical protein